MWPGAMWFRFRAWLYDGPGRRPSACLMEDAKWKVPRSAAVNPVKAMKMIENEELGPLYASMLDSCARDTLT